MEGKIGKNCASYPCNSDINQTQGKGIFFTKVVCTAALAHLLNDLIQSMLPAIFPMLKLQFALTFSQVGLIALVYQITASLLQPWIGLYTDKRPIPYLLPCGMAITLLGIIVLATASSYSIILVSSAIIGVGSATFHPEVSRVARMASGGKFGTAQSTLQVGGSIGSAFGPLLAASIIIPNGQYSIAWFGLAAAFAILLLYSLKNWTLSHGNKQLTFINNHLSPGLQRREVIQAIPVVCVLIFAKFVYISSFTNYFTFYLIEKFGVSVQQSQIYLFVFLISIAIGTLFGGFVGDRIGRRTVIWVSFLGVAPFALSLPYANFFWTGILVSVIGLVMSSAFSALVVYAQEAIPGRVGLISGLMFGLMFGISGIGAAGLGQLADKYGVLWVYTFTSFLPLLGFLTVFLPKSRKTE